MPEYITQFASKGKQEHISKVNIPGLYYPNQHINIEILHGSREHFIVPVTIKIPFNPDIESSQETHNINNNIDKTLLKKKVLMLGS